MLSIIASASEVLIKCSFSFRGVIPAFQLTILLLNTGELFTVVSLEFDRFFSTDADLFFQHLNVIHLTGIILWMWIKISVPYSAAWVN